MKKENFNLTVKTSTGEYEIKFDNVVIDGKGLCFNLTVPSPLYNWNWKKVELKVCLLGVVVPYSSHEVVEKEYFNTTCYKFIFND